MKKGIKNVFKIVIIVVVVALLIGIGYLAYKRFFNNDEKNKPEVVEKIDNFGYTLEDSDTKLFKKLFKELIKVLNEKEIDEEQYARYVAQMIVLDFYNLDNKISKSDIGGVQFVRPEQQANFTLEASETVYKYIEHNIYGNRTQKLPKVSNVSIKSMNTTTYKYKDVNDQLAYKGIVSVEYEENLGYPIEVTVVMIHDGKKLEVIKMY